MPRRTQPAEQILSPFDGRDVLASTVSITNAGDGLSKAMQVDPVEMHVGEIHHVVLECTVEKIRFDPIKDTECLQRVHILKAGTATLVDEKQVRKALDAQAKKIEEASGVLSLPLDDTDVDTDDEGVDQA